MTVANDQADGAIPSRKVALERCPGLEVRLDTPKGRGVFATLHIPAGSVIDVCPVLLLSPEDNFHVAQSSLYHYSYNWPVQTSLPSNPSKSTTKQHQAIIFGLGSMFNHSSTLQNVTWTRDLDSLTVVYRALRDIQPDEELCISYGSKLWFEDADVDKNVRESEEDVLRNVQLDFNSD